ncbi:hypothetical protein M409DRAFT_66021 [Zasmidium cellare ATCC 36951]|uniref:FAD/NAD(P)-binding domain-containing protein n=1 Tax=Zasmidium cellare ATCC 36951 TaxID=1080233 RepID=A0A6A6CLB0_ZASCE|nr:uncharacterized protein M409DRAFT_66021 [Zasmidium cellare ATCC 36951]KAF2167413.1 hypothetical protein M409DRAFT_66021 [Zasmidium cellare ATCC 36951]
MNIDTDVLIIGGGFSGMYGIYWMRKLGLKVKLLEAGSDFGGTWHWTRYSGARVDSESPYYALSIPEVYKDWVWSERFPGHEELRRYFAHIDKVLDLRKDAIFNVTMTSASFDTHRGQWTVRCHDGRFAKCRYLIMATGCNSKVYRPDLEGLHKYEGHLIHSARWPEADVDVRVKRVCIIGSGATGVQLVQNLAVHACELTACVRTPNTALPMQQRQMTVGEQRMTKNFYHSILRSSRNSWGGFPYEPPWKEWSSTTAEERQEYFEELWVRGGFSFFVSNYAELLYDKKINAEVYDFWARKVRAIIHDPVKRDIMAPLEQRHWIFTKRPSLEQNYYEVIDRDNVKVVDLHRHPIRAFTEKGIIFADNDEQDFDIVILATGYDNVTGTLLDAGLIDIDGAPTALSNGPPLAEIQIEWIGSAIEKMRKENIKCINPTLSAVEEWRKTVHDICNRTLYPETTSWFMGANVPGKPREALIYLGGLNTYGSVIHAALDSWEGFEVVEE